jgi:hypothetical protein
MAISVKTAPTVSVSLDALYHEPPVVQARVNRLLE